MDGGRVNTEGDVGERLGGEDGGGTVAGVLKMTSRKKQITNKQNNPELPLDLER